MTTITTNKLGLDVVDIQVEQTGEAQTDMFFQEPVLDFTRDYVVGVSELSIPLGEEPMLTAIKGNYSLGYIRRRATGANADTILTLGGAGTDLTAAAPPLAAPLPAGHPFQY